MTIGWVQVIEQANSLKKKALQYQSVQPLLVGSQRTLSLNQRMATVGDSAVPLPHLFAAVSLLAHSFIHSFTKGTVRQFENLLCLIHPSIITVVIMMKSSSALPAADPIGGGVAGHNSKPPVSRKNKKPQDAQEIAGFLLSLRNQRSVSPDLNDDQNLVFEESAASTTFTTTTTEAAADAGTPTSPPNPVMVPAPAAAHTTEPDPHHQHHHPTTILAEPIANVVPTQQQQHKNNPKAPKMAAVAGDPAAGGAILEDLREYNFEELIAGSTLVQLQDRDLVPDPLYVSMSQMKHCHLTQSDRVGCYKGRDLDFIGMCCKHCGGQPGFGRYFPNSLRSLAQTTTSQTILKHIASKCRFCPVDIRNAVVDLLRQQTIREGMAAGRPRYGSRKIFFQRVWARLHAGTMGIIGISNSSDNSMMMMTMTRNSSSNDILGGNAAFSGGEDNQSTTIKGEEDGGVSDETASLHEEQLLSTTTATSTTTTTTECDDNAAAVAAIDAVVAAAVVAVSTEETLESLEDIETDEKEMSKRKSSRFGALPTMSNKRSKVDADDVELENVSEV